MEHRLTPLLRQPDRENSRVFGRVTTLGQLEAKSLRRDDGSGQTARFAVAICPRGLDWPASSSSDPIRWRPPRRPRTEARPRRVDDAKKGIDSSRPVTEAKRNPPQSPRVQNGGLRLIPLSWDDANPPCESCYRRHGGGAPGAGAPSELPPSSGFFSKRKRSGSSPRGAAAGCAAIVGCCGTEGACGVIESDENSSRASDSKSPPLSRTFDLLMV